LPKLRRHVGGERKFGVPCVHLTREKGLAIRPWCVAILDVGGGDSSRKRVSQRNALTWVHAKNPSEGEMPLAAHSA